MPASHVLDRVGVTFDDDHAVANAGLILPATLLDHLGFEAAADEVVSVGYRPGRKVATVVHGILAGAECIDDLGVLRAGATDRVLSTKPMDPSTVGTWLRQLTFGHVRQLDKLTETMLARAWAGGRGTGRRADDDRCGLHDLSGARLRQAGRGLRLHPPARTAPDPGHAV